MSISLNEANQVIQQTIAKADEFGVKMSIAVCDTGGRLMAFARMDGAIWAGVYGAQGKAITAVSFNRPSGQLMEMADRPIFRGIQSAEGGNMIFAQGAVPIIKNGELIGAVGVGGGTGQQDEDCSAAGAAAISGT